jgi:hypothetical protein
MGIVGFEKPSLDTVFAKATVESGLDARPEGL